jgi:glycosyltransferase involved in cell wall biosynthesis
MEDRDRVSPDPAPGPPARLRPDGPLHVGVWCDFGQTLLPHEGIGVFVHSLARGLLSLGEPLALTLVTHPGEQDVMDDLRAEAPERVRVLPDPEWHPRFRNAAFRFLWYWVRASERLRRTGAVARALWGRWLARPKVAAKDCVKVLVRRGWAGRAAAAGAAAAALPPLWAAFAAGRLLLAAAEAAAFPVVLLDRLARRLWVNPRLFGDSYRELIRSAGCDVWLIPYVGFEYPVDFPAVVVIHDLVVYHYPGMFEPRFVERLREVIPRRAAEATLCACMSEFIKQTDLNGVLGLPPEKVRMIRPAAPGDLPRMAKEESSGRRPAFLHRPYLFLPSAFRGYKNHGRLIEALHVLRRDHGEDRFDLVFTGRVPHELPSDLDALARRLGVRGRVHVLGRVDRLTLTALYHEAFATLMPSLYEQGSFPVYEALVSGCPVACSDIPSLREQCAELGDAMLYFDPNDAASVARAVLAVRDDREGVRRRQQEASRGVWARTWGMAAAEWLPVLREAAARGKEAGPATPPAPEGRRGAA